MSRFKARMPICILPGSGETMKAARVHRGLLSNCCKQASTLRMPGQGSVSVIGILRQLRLIRLRTFHLLTVRLLLVPFLGLVALVVYVNIFASQEYNSDDSERKPRSAHERITSDTDS